MIQYKKDAHNNKWNGNGQDNTNTHPDGVIHFVIVYKDKWAHDKSDSRKCNTTN